MRTIPWDYMIAYVRSAKEREWTACYMNKSYPGDGGICRGMSRGPGQYTRSAHFSHSHPAEAAPRRNVRNMTVLRESLAQAPHNDRKHDDPHSPSEEIDAPDSRNNSVPIWIENTLRGGSFAGVGLVPLVVGALFCVNNPPATYTPEP